MIDKGSSPGDRIRHAGRANRNSIPDRQLGGDSSQSATVGTGEKQWAGLELNQRHTDFQSVRVFCKSLWQND